MLSSFFTYYLEVLRAAIRLYFSKGFLTEQYDGIIPS